MDERISDNYWGKDSMNLFYNGIRIDIPEGEYTYGIEKTDPNYDPMSYAQSIANGQRFKEQSYTFKSKNDTSKSYVIRTDKSKGRIISIKEINQ